MIVVTGTAGFIGSCVATSLRRSGHKDLVLVDDFSREDKASNLRELEGCQRVERDVFFDWLGDRNDLDAIIHIGARTDTTEFDESIFTKLNVNYSKRIWEYCAKHAVPLVYASSAATYGGGEFGYKDDHDLVASLHPLNPYGESKNNFDQWALMQEAQPPYWYGLKFFNVYGPNEYHKGRMASVIFHAYHQIKKSGEMKLFRSHHGDYKDGEQLRDFVYVKNVISVIEFLLENRPESGLYNLGTSQARTFLDLTKAVFESLDKQPLIQFIDTPEDIRDKYQYFTEADMTKLRNAGYNEPFTSLEEGVRDYVLNYLEKDRNY